MNLRHIRGFLSNGGVLLRSSRADWAGLSGRNIHVLSMIQVADCISTVAGRCHRVAMGRFRVVCCCPSKRGHQRRRIVKRVIALLFLGLVGLGVGSTLSGCVVEDGHGYHHHYYH